MSEMDGVPFRLFLPGHAAICASATKQPDSIGSLDYFDLQYLTLHDDILQIPQLSVRLSAILARRIAAHLDAVSVVNQPVEYVIGSPICSCQRVTGKCDLRMDSSAVRTEHC